jgi:hypothetical protein
MNTRILSLITLLGITSIPGSAQFVSGFENLLPQGSTYYAGEAGSTGFEDNGHFLRNDYNPAFQAWTGFALSRQTDSLTGGFGNQFSCRPGQAWEGSVFALAYAPQRIFIRRSGQSAARRALNFRLSNTTYAARSMQFGDAFAKKFGGPNGTDPDFFSLTVYNYLNGGITDSAIFYLADYRAPGTAQDYILSNWLEANLNFNHPFDSLGFELRSSDNGSFGMNTPAYFCMDQLVSENYSGMKELNTTGARFFPNPACGKAWLQLERPTEWKLYDEAGRQILNGAGEKGISALDLSKLNPGIFILHLSDGRRIRVGIQ